MIVKKIFENVTSVLAEIVKKASDKLNSPIFESTLIVEQFLWLTKYLLGLVYMHPKTDQNKQIQIEKIENNIDRWIKRFNVLNHYDSKQKLSKMIDTSYVKCNCFIWND